MYSQLNDLDFERRRRKPNDGGVRTGKSKRNPCLPKVRLLSEASPDLSLGLLFKSYRSSGQFKKKIYGQVTYFEEVVKCVFI